MNLQVIGCSHHQSSVATREQLAFTEQQIKPFLDNYYSKFPNSEVVLLSTCNRTEFYTAANKPNSVPGKSELIEFIAEQRGIAATDINSEIFIHQDRQAVEHLFSVASSLDSMVVGEAQILSQVKQAYKLAVETNQTAALIHRVFQSAIRVARRISNETEIHTNRVSVPSVAIGVLAKQIFERLDNKKILILGAGEMAEETLRYAIQEGGKDFTIINRSIENAKQLAMKFDGRVGDWDELEKELATADLVISATGATKAVVNSDLFDRVEEIRKQKPIFILDLAVPRDFEHSISDRLNVYLYTLDDLQKECERNRQSRQSHYPKAQKIINHEADLFFNEIQRRSSGSTIAQLKRQADNAKQLELDRLMNRLEGVSEKQKSEIEQSFNRLVNKILHPPLKSLQTESPQVSGGLLEALKKLFQLGD